MFTECLISKKSYTYCIRVIPNSYSYAETVDKYVPLYTFLLLLLWIIVPIPSLQITLPDNEIIGNKTLENITIGDPLTLHCIVTAVRGISSSVDIIWTTEGRVVRRVDNITPDIKNDTAIYTDSFKLLPSSAIDNGEYQCIVVINASQTIINRDQVTVIIPNGEYSYIEHCRQEVK